jgi:hypothetical protein
MSPSRSKRDTVDPNRPHAIVETNDAGLAAFASGGSQYSGSQVNMAAVTSGHIRATRCGVPGCHRTREDVIHAPADD